MRYRYITANCKPNDKIYNFRLISHRVVGSLDNYVGTVIYRVRIPDDLKLLKYPCDDYSTTRDTRTIEELGYDVIIVMWNGKRRVVPKDADIEAVANEQYHRWISEIARVIREKGVITNA